MNGPDPTVKHPMAGFPRVCFIKNTVNNPNIIIGDYSYYDDPDDSENFERNVLYHYPFIGDKLMIGKFCAIAHGVKFCPPRHVSAQLVLNEVNGCPV